MGALHQIFEMLVDIGENRFRRHEDEGGILCLAANEIFLGDIANMHLHVPAELLHGGTFGFRRLVRLDGVPGFQRKLGIDDERRRIVRHLDGAVRPVTVRKCRLQLEGTRRQGVGDQRLHARLSEGAACLLVGKYRLKPDHVLGQILNIALCGIDDRQALLKAAQIFMGRPGLLGQRFAQPLRHAIKTLIQRLAHLRLTRAERFRHGRDPAMQFGLGFEQVGDLAIRPSFLRPVCRHKPCNDKAENRGSEKRAEADID